MTRLFGECELGAPADYIQTVKSSIQKWRSTGRYENAIKTATNMGYTPAIAEEFINHNLPPQFFYLAMQESSFDAFTSGPITRSGYAKGMWQFRLPENRAERNFWKLLERFRIPEQTYDYVFYIVSAAVIGENPGLFGFQFDNPLGFVEKR